ncbi:nonstructural protein [Blackfly microvirus SF02]|uniref:Nonstructural protein n=1 Tax=Blackfly microvirus SF02 TaxID=2576452 RepID=A0A4P8PKQ9_9VIRU|nr:nonstructural protein [Blackfly microvirus SF02]
MIYQVFAIKDAKAGAFALPFFLPRMEVALRSFKDAVSDPKHEISRHLEDYSLWCLGEFDDNTGAMLPVPPVLVAEATDQVRKDSMRNMTFRPGVDDAVPQAAE